MTAFSTLYPYFRFLLGDQDADIPQIDSGQFDAGMKLVIDTDEDFDDYTYDDDGITPSITDKAVRAKLIWKTVKWMTGQLCSGSSFRTRAYAEAVQGNPHLHSDILQKVYELENGEMNA